MEPGLGDIIRTGGGHSCRDEAAKTGWQAMRLEWRQRGRGGGGVAYTGGGGGE